MPVKKTFRIIFMGTPQFAVPSLDALYHSPFEVVAVITATDKLGGRGGKQLLQSAVKKYAVKHDIPVLQPKNLKSKEFISDLAAYKADLQIVVAFRMLPVVVWDMPPMGTVNLHASLLPNYRGAAPIHWAIINGEKETGLTTFKLKHQIDTGDIIDQLTIPIEFDDTMGSLATKMSQEGAKLLVTTAEKVYHDKLELKPQDAGNRITQAPKIYFKDAEINFSQSTEKVYNFIRGMNPFPVAWTKIDNKVTKIFRCLPIDTLEYPNPGIIRVHDKSLFVYTMDGAIKVEQLQVEGKSKMQVSDWLNGYQIKNLKIG